MEGDVPPTVVIANGDDPLARAADMVGEDSSMEVREGKGGNAACDGNLPSSTSIPSSSSSHQMLRRRRKLLADVFANSRFNVLDAARREQWDDVERVRREVEDAEEWIEVAADEDTSDKEDAEMRRRFHWSEESWKQVFEKLILSDDASTSSTTTRDDLLYFVQNAVRLRSRAASSVLRSSSGPVTQFETSSPPSPTMSSSSTASYSTATTTGNPPPKTYDDLHVRRWMPQLPSDIESMSDCYHWQNSLLLNLILQTQYVMTIAVYDSVTLHQKRELQLRSPHGANTAEQHRQLKPILEVRKRVYASPHFEVFDDSSKGLSDRDASAGMQQSFPTLYFAVCEDNDGERDLLESVILSDPEHCLCVILNASLEEDIWGRDDDEHEEPVPVPHSGESAPRTKTRVKLFSGFVTYAQLTESYREQSAWKGYLSRKASTRLGMRGPRGKGRAEVAVEESKEKQQSNPTAADATGGSESSTGVMRRMASSFSMRRVMKAARGAITRVKDTATDEQRLRCFLVSLELPWEAVAHDILNRVSRDVHQSLSS